MGERGNIGFIQNGWDGSESVIEGAIFLYTHWSGYRAEALAAKAIEAAKPRWGDETYAVRIALTKLIGEVEGDTGWGVGISPGENSYPMPIINFDAREVRIISARDGDTQDTKRILEAYKQATAESFEAFLGRDHKDA